MLNNLRLKNFAEGSECAKGKPEISKNCLDNLLVKLPSPHMYI